MAYPVRNRQTRQSYGTSTPVSTTGPALPSLPRPVTDPRYVMTRPYNRQSQIQQTPNRPAPYPQVHNPAHNVPQVTAQGPSQPQPQRQVYRRPDTHPPGPLPFFVPPPGQPTYDPTLSTPPSAQALHSTYPSRLRTGVTGLLQPETITGGPREREYLLAELDRELAAAGSGTSTPRLESPAPYGGAGGGGGGRRSTLSGRATGRGGRVNYAEREESYSEDEESSLSEMEEPPSDPDDTSYGERRRRDRDRSNDPRLRVAGGGARGGSGPSWAAMSVAEQQASLRANKLKRRQEEMERGLTWLGDRTPGERVTSTRAQYTQHIFTPEELLKREAGRATVLVPITVDLIVDTNRSDKDAIKIKDRFLWNMNEPFITPHQFASIFCRDVGISVDPYAETVAELIQGQLDEASGCVDIDLVDREVTEDDVVWSEDEEVQEEDEGMDLDGAQGGPSAARSGKVDGLVNGTTDAPAVNGGPQQEGSAQPNGRGESKSKSPSAAQEGQAKEDGERDQQQEDPDEAEEGEEEDAEEEEGEVEVEEEKVWQEPDCRVIVNLDVQIYTYILRDRIEWDLSSSLPPTTFAKHYCSELGLSGEAIPLIAHAITDELLKHKRDALELRLFRDTHPEEQGKWEKGGAAGMRVNSRKGAKQLVGVWRDWWEREEFAPVLVELTMEEMERRDVESKREARRMMRTIGPRRRR